jgi:hypothetical protein
MNFREAANLLVLHCGKARLVKDLGTDDFATLRTKISRKNWGAIRIRNLVQRVRKVFKFFSITGRSKRL